MKVNLDIEDVRLEDTADSSGSIGSLVANITWSSEGIKETVQDRRSRSSAAFVTGVTTNPSDGTIELEGALGSVTAKPQVVTTGWRCRWSIVRARLHAAARDCAAGARRVHLAADEELSAGHPGRRVSGHRYRCGEPVLDQNASIPKGDDDPCFADL